MSAATVKVIVKYSIVGSVTILTMVGFGYCFYVMGTRALSPMESQLWGSILAALGIFFSWLVTHLYAQLSTQSATEDAKKAHNESVRTFALKAAEKVLTLSGEIDRVAERLKLALEDTEEEEKLAVAALTLRERIGAAIQSLETIKAVNNNALSDWRSIIGEDIKLQNQLQDQITQLMSKIESLVPTEELDEVREQMDVIRSEFKDKVAALPFGLPPAAAKKRRTQPIEVSCPECDAKREMNIRMRAGAQKMFRCRGCSKYLRVRYVSEAAPPAEMRHPPDDRTDQQRPCLSAYVDTHTPVRKAPRNGAGQNPATALAAGHAQDDRRAARGLEQHGGPGDQRSHQDGPCAVC